MQAMLLEMREVSKRFPGVLALDRVSLSLKDGEILGIVGENGAGKSTLMKVLSGSYVQGSYEGELAIDGQTVSFRSVADAQAHGIEMIYQEMNMMLDASIAENLFVGNLPGRMGLVDYPKLYKDTAQLLERIGLDLDPAMKVRPLNSGQMQLLSLMRAVAKKPRILVLDEPTTALTDSEVDILMQVLESLRSEGVSCLYISHKLEEIYRICDRVYVLRDGQSIAEHPVEGIVEQELIEEMVGRKVENLYPKTRSKQGAVALEVSHLKVPHPSIRGKYIIEDLSFSVRAGEILGIGGLVGAGRSETLGAIFAEITEGVEKEIKIQGEKVQIKHPQDAIAHGMGYITEERKRSGIIWMLSIRENMAVANLKALAGRIFMKRKEEKRQCQEVFDKLRVKAPSLESKLITLSGGNQQKTILAKWLLNKPSILLIDEPTKGIDVGTKADFYRLMGELTEAGVAIVMVSSDMPELIAMSDRCLVLAEGRLSAELTGDAINERAVMRAAIGLSEESAG